MNTYSAIKNEQIIILDPGLREHGGHHPAFILSMLNCEVFKKETTAVTIYTNKKFDKGGLFDDISTGKKNDLIPFFDIDYYQYFYASTAHPELSSFIRRLTLQYLAALTQSNKSHTKQKNTSQIYFFHTLGWEHATALADALYLFEKQTGANIQMVVLLMFSPYRHCDKSTYEHKVYLKFTISFKRLALFKYISFFACDHETSRAYEHIMGRKIEICPLPFLSHKFYPRHQDKQTSTRQIILYMGDTKATKGFLTLPSLVRQFIKANKSSDECVYIIQYTLTNTSDEFIEADKQLKDLAKQHKTINVFDEFWSEEKLHQTLANSYAIIFNYDSHVYQFQSSGVLWLAAHYHLKIIFLNDNWLVREAERLNCDYILCTLEPPLTFTNIFDERGRMKNSFNARITKKNIETYSTALFGNFNSWLKSNLITDVTQ